MAIATVAIINFVSIWSEFLFASVRHDEAFGADDPVAVAALGGGAQGADLGLWFAGLSLATIPVLILYFLFSQRIVSGITAGAVK